MLDTKDTEKSETWPLLLGSSQSRRGDSHQKMVMHKAVSPRREDLAAQGRTNNLVQGIQEGFSEGESHLCPNLKVEEGLVVYTCNLSPQEGKAGRSQILGQPGLHKEFKRTCLKEQELGIEFLSGTPEVTGVISNTAKEKKSYVLFS